MTLPTPEELLERLASTDAESVTIDGMTVRRRSVMEMLALYKALKQRAAEAAEGNTLGVRLRQATTTTPG